MKSLAVTVLVLFCIGLLIKPASQSCDQTLSDLIDKNLDDLGETFSLVRVREVFSRNNATINQFAASECSDYFGEHSEHVCRGGKFIVIQVPATPDYCSWLGSGPAKISLRFDKQELTVGVSTEIPNAIFSAGWPDIEFE